MKRIALVLAITPALVQTAYAQQPPHGIPPSIAEEKDQPYAFLVFKKVKPLARMVAAQNQREIQGNPSAKVRVVVAADGKVTQKELVQSSGNPEWDAIALKVVQQASPFPPPPRQSRTFTITLRPHD